MPNVWILTPVVNCTTFVAEEAKIGGLLQRALSHVELGRPLLENAAIRFLQAGLPDVAEPLIRLIASAPLQEQWAKELRETDYSVLNAHSLVAIWGAVETCLEDTVVAILMHSAHLPELLSSLGVKAKAGLTVVDEDEAHALYMVIERKLAVKGDVVASYEAVLNAFRLSAAVGSEDANTLRELNGVRNCLVHRGGLIDAKAVRQAPALARLVGKRIEVGKEQFLKYHDAVGKWLVSLMGSICSSSYILTDSQETTI